MVVLSIDATKSRVVQPGGDRVEAGSCCHPDQRVIGEHEDGDGERDPRLMMAPFIRRFLCQVARASVCVCLASSGCGLNSVWVGPVTTEWCFPGVVRRDASRSFSVGAVAVLQVAAAHLPVLGAIFDSAKSRRGHEDRVERAR